MILAGQFSPEPVLNLEILCPGAKKIWHNIKGPDALITENMGGILMNFLDYE